MRVRPSAMSISVGSHACASPAVARNISLSAGFLDRRLRARSSNPGQFIAGVASR